MFTRNKPANRRWKNKFNWAVGVEDTFVPQFRAGQRALDEYELTEHYRRWREDLALATSLGVTQMRWGMPWFKVEEIEGVYDWSWTDQVLTHMINDLHIEPIVDLVHYGTPAWLDESFLDPRFPQAMARLAAAFAERYKGFVQCYTPLNEPTVTADFCGRRAEWPPYADGDRGYVQVLLAISQAIQLSVRAIRKADKRAVIFSVEATCRYLVEEHKEAAPYAALKFNHDMLCFDLVSGVVDEEHPLNQWLQENGADPDQLALLRDRPTRPDILGVNFYPWSAQVVSIVDGEPVSRGTYADGRMLSDVIALASQHVERHGHGPLPIYVTETSAVIFRRPQWLSETVTAINLARREGLNVIGYTWFPFFSMIAWDYRTSTRPLAEHLLHLGLWELEPIHLNRVESADVERFRQVVKNGVVPRARLRAKH